MKHINFTPDKLRKLKLAYNEAIQHRDEQFEFEGDIFLTAYAKYVIEYLDGQFNTRKVKVQ